MTGPQYGPPPGGGWQPPQQPGGQPPYGDPGYGGQPPHDPSYGGQPGYDPAYGGQQQPGYDPGYGQPSGVPYNQPASGVPSSGPPYGPPTSGGPYDPAYQQSVPAPPPSSNGKVWIIGGVVVAVVLLLICGVGIVVLNSKGGSSGTGSSGAKYQGVDDLCVAADNAAPMKDIIGEPKKAGEKNKSGYGDWISMRCSLDMTGGSSNGSGYMSLSASVYGTDKKAKDEFTRTVEREKNSTGTGRSQDKLSGIGEQGYFTKEERKSSYSTSLSYKVYVQDGNLSLDISMNGSREQWPSDADLQEKLKQVAQKIMENLKK